MFWELCQADWLDDVFVEVPIAVTAVEAKENLPNAVTWLSTLEKNPSSTHTFFCVSFSANAGSQPQVRRI